MQKRYLTFAALLTAGMLNGQTRLLWNNGTKAPEPNISTINLQFTGEQSVGNKVFKVLTFENTPSFETQKSLSQAGVSFFSYLPKNAWLVEMPRGMNRELLQSSGVNGVYGMGWFEKTSKNMWEGAFPDYGYTSDGLVEVNLLVFPGIDATLASETLRGLNGRMVSYQPVDGHILAHVPQNQVRQLARVPFIYWIQEAEPPAEPENHPGRTNHRVNTLNNPIPGITQYDGTGVTVGHGDDGDIGPHIDYTGRLTSKAGPSNGNHGDHVAGTIMGAGNLNPLGRGMAPGADLVYYDYPDNLNDVDVDYSLYNIRVTNSSYSNGCNAGYTSFARQMDIDINEHPKLMHVFSAGNSGTTSCGYGPGLSTWGNITGGHKQGKNVVTVGNLTNLNAIASSSSRGPAHDGRIKPEVAAVGTDVFSTYGGNIYASISGTSMACPGTVGTITDLIHAFKDTHAGAEPDGGLMKVILANTADDLGVSGPDFIYGYGRINGRRAFQTISNNWFVSDSINTNGTKTHSIAVPAGTAQLKVALFWVDPAALPNASRALVNDLDMTLSGGTITTPLKPWVLDPTPVASALASPAVQATDTLNNLEQITLNNPTDAIYTVTVSGTAVPTGPYQSYFVVWYIENENPVLTHPYGGEQLVPGTQEILRWDSPATTSPFSLEYSADSGTTWNTISSTINANFRQFTWTVPNVPTGKGLFRLTNGTKTSTSVYPVTIMGQPNNLQILKVCPDTLEISCSPITGAAGYIVYKLGAKYMDSIGYSTTNIAKVGGINPLDADWLAIAAVPASGKAGRRSVAILRQPGTLNCILTEDLGIAAMVSPFSGSYPNCQTLSFNEQTVEVVNPSTTDVYSFTYNHQVGTNLPVATVVNDTILAGQSKTVSIPAPVAFTPGVTTSFKTWVSLPNDQNKYNDTAFSTISTFNSGLAPLPVVQGFEGLTNCSVATNCGATSCPLPGNWRNAPNGSEDDIDFRVISSGTASAGTGPSGAASGSRYVYLEASGTCSDQTARLISPCIDLSGTTLPELKYKYHMLGNNQGELHVDLIVDGAYLQDIVPAVVGDQGSNWIQASVSLVPYIGSTVNVVFRGITGNGFASDLALDDIEIIENTSAPAVAFTASSQSPCVGQTISLKDQSLNAPASWNWSISPSTFQFENGTNATSQFPDVSFTALGSYTIKLKATNQFGSDSLTQTSFISVAPGVGLPVQELFAGAFPPVDWSIDNPDNADTWQQVTGLILPGIGLADAAMVDNFSYNAPGQEDYLVALRTQLPASPADAQLVFDVAYAQYDASYEDGLRIDVSTDCGETFVPTSYLKIGATLASAPAQTTGFVPNASQWRTDTVDLSNWVGADIVIRFANINDYGNRLYIGNVRLVNSASIGVQESALAQGWMIYPNPANKSLALQNIQGEATVRILSVAGQILREVHLSQAENQVIDVQRLPAGAYFLQVNQNEVVKTFAWIKQ